MATPLRTHTHEWNTQQHSGKRHHGWLALVVVLAFCLSSSLAFGQAQPPGPVVQYQFRTPGQPQPTRFNLVHSLLHFDPGAATYRVLKPARPGAHMTRQF